MQNRPVVGRRNLRMATILLLVLALGAAYTFLERRTWAQAKEAPRFEVDPFWPKALPNHWARRSASGWTNRTWCGSFIADRQRSLTTRRGSS